VRLIQGSWVTVDEEELNRGDSLQTAPESLQPARLTDVGSFNQKSSSVFVEEKFSTICAEEEASGPIRKNVFRRPASRARDRFVCHLEGLCAKPSAFHQMFEPPKKRKRLIKTCREDVRIAACPPSGIVRRPETTTRSPNRHFPHFANR